MCSSFHAPFARYRKQLGKNSWSRLEIYDLYHKNDWFLHATVHVQTPPYPTPPHPLTPYVQHVQAFQIKTPQYGTICHSPCMWWWNQFHCHPDGGKHLVVSILASVGSHKLMSLINTQHTAVLPLSNHEHPIHLQLYMFTATSFYTKHRSCRGWKTTNEGNYSEGTWELGV